MTHEVIAHLVRITTARCGVPERLEDPVAVRRVAQILEAPQLVAAPALDERKVA